MTNGLSWAEAVTVCTHCPQIPALKCYRLDVTVPANDDSQKRYSLWSCRGHENLHKSFHFFLFHAVVQHLRNANIASCSHSLLVRVHPRWWRGTKLLVSALGKNTVSYKGPFPKLPEMFSAVPESIFQLHFSSIGGRFSSKVARCIY